VQPALPADWAPLRPCVRSLEKEKEAKGEGAATTPLLAGTRHRDLDQELGVVTGGALERLLVLPLPFLILRIDTMLSRRLSDNGSQLSPMDPFIFPACLHII